MYVFYNKTYDIRTLFQLLIATSHLVFLLSHEV